MNDRLHFHDSDDDTVFVVIRTCKSRVFLDAVCSTRTDAEEYCLEWLGKSTFPIENSFHVFRIHVDSSESYNVTKLTTELEW